MLLDLDILRRRVHDFSFTLEQEYYLHYSGQKPTLDLESVFARHEDLFTREHCLEFQDRHRSEPTIVHRRFLKFLVDGWVRRHVRSLQEEIAREESHAAVVVSGETIPYRTVPSLLRREPDRRRRSAIYWAKAEADARFAWAYRSIWERVHLLVESLGYRDYVECCSELTGIDLEQLGDRMADVILRTDDVYRDLFEPRAEERVGVPLSDLRPWDRDYLLTEPAVDRHFPRAALLPTARLFLSDLGFDLDREPALRIDLEDRPHKGVRAFCAPVEMGGAVHLVLRPQGGLEDYEALLHELGHGFHFAYTDRNLPVEDTVLGDPGVTESHAFLFQGLLRDRGWVGRYVTNRGPDAERIAVAAKRLRIYMLRRYAGKLLYELHLGRTGLRGAADRYAEEMTRSLGILHDGLPYLSDVDLEFYVAHYLRAWQFEAVARRSFREQFGPAWSSSRETGDRLRGLWARGSADDLEELAIPLDSRGLTADALLDDLLVDSW